MGLPTVCRATPSEHVLPKSAATVLAQGQRTGIIPGTADDMCTALANGTDEIPQWVFAHTTHHHGGAGAAYRRSYCRKCKALDGLCCVCWAAEEELSRWVATA
eukprot:2280352-Rhodomonas_salina.1